MVKKLDITNVLSSIKSANISTIAFSICAVILFLMIYWIQRKLTLQKRNINRMKGNYPDFPLISNMSSSNDNYNHNLRDYYIKTAYNCCATGGFKHDFVADDALKTCLRQGVRGLDFQIYSLDDQPVIAVSSETEFNVKGSYNSLPFSSVMKIISNYAFSGSTSPCPDDPLILHFRIMTKNMNILDKMAQDLSVTLNRRLLGKKFSYENGGENIGSLPIKSFRNKVIIIVDKSLANPMKTKLDEYVNLTSNSMFMRSLRYRDVKFTPDMQELIDYNKKNMTMCLPDLGDNPINPSSSLAMKYGCQLVAMSFQKMDANMLYYNKLFNEEGSSFILKPESLRYKPITIDIPDPPPKEYSYEEREIKSDFYNFKM